MLRQTRHARRIDRLELSLRMGVLLRHVNFLEGGRSCPSRSLLSAWLQELDSPLALRNVAMLQAGVALIDSAAPLGDPSLTDAEEAMAQLLQACDPMPALLIDAQWNLFRPNHDARWLALKLMPGAAGLLQRAPLNMLDRLALPEAARPDSRLIAGPPPLGSASPPSALRQLPDRRPGRQPGSLRVEDERAHRAHAMRPNHSSDNDAAATTKSVPSNASSEVISVGRACICTREPSR